MSRFGPDPLTFFDSVYTDVPPWDVGGPQPAMAALLSDYPPSGPALDLGCGSGDLAIHLAQKGLDVLGIDFVEAAVHHARAKAAELAPELSARLQFEVADALHLTRLGRTFATVVDSGFFHLFAPEVGEALLSEIERVLISRGRLYLHEFAIEFPIPNVPRQVTGDELRALLVPERGWNLLEIRDVQFDSRVGSVPAVIACAERLPLPSDS